jgi:CRP/FNR family cyclic AMP-dependent transcriptional regulator
MAVSEIILKSCSLFRHASPGVVQKAASQMSLLLLKKREVLLINGRPFRGLGVVLEGRLQSMDYTIDGREVALTTVDGVSAFGQANLIAPRPVDLTWVAVTPSTLAVMSPQAALELLQSADMSMQVAVDLAQQVCEFLSWQKILSVHPINARVCAWLSWAANESDSLTIPRHAELAWRLSTTRESITRTFQKLQAEQVLRRDGDLWFIDNMEVLKKMALGDSKGIS